MTSRALMTLGALATGIVTLGSYAWADELAKRNTELTYQVSFERIPDGAKAIDLWIPIAQDTDGQTVGRVSVTYPEGGAIAVEPEHGNKMWHKRFVAPFDDDLRDGKLGAEVVVEVHRAEIVIPQAKELAPAPKLETKFAKYLESNTLIPIDHDPIVATAAKLKLANDPPIVAARKVYDWLIDEFTYNYKAPGAGKGDVRWACDSKTGDCTDYHSMFIALMRNQGIPADHEFGFPVRVQASEGRIPSYHCWARFYVEGIGWIPLDASEADKHPEDREYNFGSQSANLFKFTHGRDVTLAPPQQGPALNKFIHPYVEVDGVPFDEIEFSMHFRDLK